MPRLRVIAGCCLLSLASTGVSAAPPVAAPEAPQRALIDRYCVSCHNERLNTGGLALDTLDIADVGAAADRWEAVVEKLRGGMMPPAGRPRPEPAEYDGFRRALEAALDRAAEHDPRAGACADAPAEPRGSIRTPFAICWRSRSTAALCCRPRSLDTASTTWRARWRFRRR